ncbi:plexin-C1-like [Carassius auratus]|uniref:Plexin-C1-like n=1 Tax=Carassius auratus TaxID=7957 RepID=A0A6P6P7A4_CARAU|nr:plexin-C1-like [Carassius auratus]
MYLTKLLSTKVAVHSFVENLFRSIWGLPNNRAPMAIKYFFDFLDVQAERKKISDPDVSPHLENKQPSTSFLGEHPEEP